MKFLDGVHIQSGTKAHDLLESKDPKDREKAKKLTKFCKEAEQCFYEYNAMVKLREKYKNII